MNRIVFVECTQSIKQSLVGVVAVVVVVLNPMLRAAPTHFCLHFLFNKKEKKDLCFVLTRLPTYLPTYRSID